MYNIGMEYWNRIAFTHGKNRIESRKYAKCWKNFNQKSQRTKFTIQGLQSRTELILWESKVVAKNDKTLIIALKNVED